jgi:hypothetical protein
MTNTAPAWRGDWQDRIAQRIREAGFDSYAAFLEAKPGLSYAEMARLLGDKEDIAPVQLARLHASSIQPRDRERAIVDSLTRFLRGSLKKGWGLGKYWQSDVGGALASWKVTWGSGPELNKLESALHAVGPPSGWIPEAEADPILQRAVESARER